MSDDATPPPALVLRRGDRPAGTAPTGPRSAGLCVVLPLSDAAAVVDLTARRTRAAVVVDLTTQVAGGGDERHLSIQDRVRLRALEAAGAAGPQCGQLEQVAPWPGRTPSTR